MFFIFEFCFMKDRYVGDTVEQLFAQMCREKRKEANLDRIHGKT